MTDIAFASAKRLATLIRNRKIGCLELLEHFLGRVEKYNPTLNAIIATDLVGARKRARAADRALTKGDVWGPLHGLPMTVKEAFQMKGLPTTWGVPEYRDNIARSNAISADRWLKGGVVLFGKTNVPIWLGDGQSFNAIYGATSNPWDLSRTPGGSSGGSAAAVASGLTGIEMGSDIAGSIRNPAHCCGVYSHKPTYDICPQRGYEVADRISPDDISTIGPIGRSARDLDIGLSIMAGPDEIEAAGYRLTLPLPRKKALKDFRVGIILNDPISETSDEVKQLLQKLADFLARKKKVRISAARPALDMARVHEVFLLLLRGATSHRQTDQQFAENLKDARALDSSDQTARARTLRGNTMYHREWLALHEERTEMRWRWHEFFKTYDILLCPAYPIEAHSHVHDIPPAQRIYTLKGQNYSHSDQLFWSGVTGVAYLPATIAPIGFTNKGLPVGVQIVGPHFGDRTTIHFAKLLEDEYQGFVPPPGYD